MSRHTKRASTQKLQSPHGKLRVTGQRSAAPKRPQLGHAVMTLAEAMRAMGQDDVAEWAEATDEEWPGGPLRGEF